MRKKPSFPFPFPLFFPVLFLIFLAGPSVLRAEVVHTVKPGESLYAIGKKYQVAPQGIIETNQLNGEKIRAGQKLVIPGAKSRENPAAKSVSAAEGETPGSPKTPAIHKVKKGETLGAIAKKYGAEIEELKKINGLKTSKVKVGQAIRLRLEEDEESGAEESEDGEGITAQKEEPPAYVQGNGFLLGEKSRELLGRVARSFQGFRYTKGGGSINGMDCSSYVQRVYKVFGVDLPRTAREQFRMGYTVAKNALQVGDLVFFKRAKSREPTHVGIYLGDNKYIHTSLTKRQVEIDSLDGRYANLHFIGAKRIEELEVRQTRLEPEAE